MGEILLEREMVTRELSRGSRRVVLGGIALISFPLIKKNNKIT